MTRDKTKEAIAVMQGYVDGKQIQWRHTGCDNAWEDCSNEPSWAFSECEYRISPEPKYRRWTIGDIPVGALYRDKMLKRRVVIIGAGFGDHAIQFINWCAPYNTTGDSFDTALSNREHSTDGGKTWHPCGILEGGNQ